MDEVALGQVSQSTSVFSYQYHSTKAPYLSSSEGQKSNAWEYCKKQCSFENHAALETKVPSLSVASVVTEAVMECSHGCKFYMQKNLPYSGTNKSAFSKTHINF
jgi:hypothetical protein